MGPCVASGVKEDENAVTKPYARSPGYMQAGQPSQRGPLLLLYNNCTIVASLSTSIDRLLEFNYCSSSSCVMMAHSGVTRRQLHARIVLLNDLPS
jgi:hypothetical protein